jgi:HSP20 family protein
LLGERFGERSRFGGGLEDAIERRLRRRELAEELFDGGSGEGFPRRGDLLENAIERRLRRRELAEELLSEPSFGRSTGRPWIEESMGRRPRRREVVEALLGERQGAGGWLDEAIERRLMRRELAEDLTGEMPFEQPMRGRLPEDAIERRLRRRDLVEALMEEAPIGRHARRRELAALLEGGIGERLGRRRGLAESFDVGVGEQIMRHRASRAAFTPKTDVYEQDGTLVIKADLPGLKKNDVEVTVDQGDLVISGERKPETPVKDEDYYQGEQTYGKFYRRVPLPEGVKPDQIKAAHKDGVLEIDIPIPPQSKVALA